MGTRLGSWVKSSDMYGGRWVRRIDGGLRAGVAAWANGQFTVYGDDGDVVYERTTVDLNAAKAEADAAALAYGHTFDDAPAKPAEPVARTERPAFIEVRDNATGERVIVPTAGLLVREDRDERVTVAGPGQVPFVVTDSFESLRRILGVVVVTP